MSLLQQLIERFGYVGLGAFLIIIALLVIAFIKGGKGGDGNGSGNNSRPGGTPPSPPPTPTP